PAFQFSRLAAITLCQPTRKKQSCRQVRASPPKTRQRSHQMDWKRTQAQARLRPFVIAAANPRACTLRRIDHRASYLTMDLRESERKERRCQSLRCRQCKFEP